MHYPKKITVGSEHANMGTLSTSRHLDRLLNLPKTAQTIIMLMLLLNPLAYS